MHLWFTILLACSDPAPPADAGSSTTLPVVHDTTAETRPTATTADTGLAPLELAFFHDDGTPAGDDEPLRWTMWHGPAGGWYLTPPAELGPFPSEETVYLAIDAVTEGGEPVFSTLGPQFTAFDPVDGTVTLDLLLGPRLYIDPFTTNLELVCAAAGTERPLRFTIDQIEPPNGEPLPTPTIRSVQVERQVRLELDPMDEVTCGEL